MNDDNELIAEAARRIMADLADPQTVNSANDTSWKAPLWTALEEAGLTRAWIPEARGGAGIGRDATFETLRIAGMFGAPVAVAETLIAGWAMSEAGLDVPGGVVSIAPVRSRDNLEVNDLGAVSGRASSVPFARDASRLVIVSDEKLAVVPAGGFVAVPRQSDVGGERCDVLFDGSSAEQVVDFSGGWAAVEVIGATARACQMAGALETSLALTTEYSGEREAFGRKIGKFQAVQQNLARLAGEVAAALTASGSAADTLSQEPIGSDTVFLETASAKIRVGEAVETGAAIAHQAHGAIGWTQDYTLQLFTRSMMGWRDDFGSEAEWAVRLGAHVAGGGADRLWPYLTSR